MLNEIDTLQGTLDSLGQVLDAHTFETMEKRQAEMQQTDQQIKSGYLSDTLPLETARNLKRWKKSYLLLEPLSQSYPMLRKAIENEREQLKKLWEDMKHGDGARDKYAGYLRQERNNVHDLRLLITEYQESYREVEETYTTLNPEVELFAQNLKATQVK